MTSREHEAQPRFRAAVVGLQIGERHVAALDDYPHAQVVAVCDAAELRARTVGTRYNARVYTDYTEMLDSEQLDGVCIATPNALHGPMVRDALRRGLHVLCEKPLALHTEEARELLALARTSGLTHATNFSNRLNPTVRYLQEQVQAGVLGRIHEIHMSYLQDWLSDPAAPYSWRNNQAESGSGALGDIGSHMLDLARLFVGEVAAVSAQMKVVTPRRQRPDGTTATVDADDLAYLQLRYLSGAVGTLHVSRVARGRNDRRRVELYGERASMVLEIDKDLNHVLRADEVTQWRGDGFQSVFSSNVERHNWGGIVQAWVEAALARREMAPNFEDGVRICEILDAALRSDAAHCWTTI